jgi:SAM-dependent methyltransferase
VALGLDPARPEADIKGFFPQATQRSPLQFGAITAFNVFAHTPDPVGFAREAARLLVPDGWFVIEVTEVARLLAGARLDTCYHEHYWYWSRSGLAKVLERQGFAIRQIEVFPAQGGSMRVWAQKAEGPAWVADEGYLCDPDPWVQAESKWAYRVSALANIVRDGKRWAAYGAAAKGVILAYAADLGPNELSYVVDETPDKQGRLTPYGVPIVGPERLLDDPPDGVAILAWNYAREIRAKLRAFGGRVIVA